MGFLICKRVAKDPETRRKLFELVEDRDALAALDRETMGQTRSVEVMDVPVRGGDRG